MELTERSLLHFLNHIDIDLDSLNQNLGSVKKQIQLEFKSTKNGIMLVDGLEYDSNFIVSELDNPNITQTLRYERIIKEIDWLDAFINKAYFDFSDTMYGSNNNLLHFFKRVCIPVDYDTEEFRNYISPKMAKSFNTISRNLLEQDLFYKQRIILNLLEYIQPTDYELAFQYLRLMLNDALKSIRNSNKENYLKKGSQIERWTINSAGIFINSLPDAFSSYKIDFVKAMTSFLVDLQKADTKLSYRLSFQLINIESIPHELKALIAKNHAIFKRINDGLQDPNNAKNENGVSIWRIVLIIFFFIKFIVLLSRI